MQINSVSPRNSVSFGCGGCAKAAKSVALITNTELYARMGMARMVKENGGVKPFVKGIIKDKMASGMTHGQAVAAFNQSLKPALDSIKGTKLNKLG